MKKIKEMNKVNIAVQLFAIVGVIFVGVKIRKVQDKIVGKIVENITKEVM